MSAMSMGGAKAGAGAGAASAGVKAGSSSTAPAASSFVSQISQQAGMSGGAKGTMGGRVSGPTMQPQGGVSGAPTQMATRPAASFDDTFSQDRAAMGEILGTMLASADSSDLMDEAGSGLVFRANGGPVAPGQTAVVGEQGPETVQVSPGGDVNVQPMTASTARWQAQQEDRGVLDFIKGVGKGILNATAYGRQINEERTRRRTQALMDAVVHSPELARDPVVRKELSKYFGDQGEVLDLIAASRSADPAMMEQAIGQIEQMVGIQGGVEPQPGQGQGFGVLQPGQTVTPPASQRLARIGQNLPAGASLAVTPGKTPRLTMTGGTRTEQFEKAFDRVFAEELRAANGDTDLASINATKRAAEELGVSNLPKWATDILTYDTRIGEEGVKSDIIEAREKSMAKFRKRLDVENKRQEAFEAEAGQRQAALATPKTPEESRAKAAQLSGQPIREPLPASEVTKVTDRQNSLQQLSAAFELMNPDQLGPLAGRFTSMRQAFGALGFKEEESQAAIDMVLRAHRLLTTGQAASERELQDLRKTILNTNMAPEQFAARLTGLTKEAVGQATTYADTLRQSGYEVPAFRMSKRLQDFVQRMSPGPEMVPLGGGPAGASTTSTATSAAGGMTADEFRSKYPHLFRGR